MQQLRIAVTLSKTLSFTATAAELGLAQSVVSRQLARLEAELGVGLFARTSRRVELTEAGAAFTAEATASLAAVERAIRSAQGTAGEVHGVVRIGAIPSVTALNLPGVLARAAERYPSVAVELTIASSDLLAEAVRRGDLDVALLGLAPDELPRGVHSRDLGDERLAAIVAPRHRLAGADELALADLSGERFVDFTARSPARRQSDAALAVAGVARTVAYEIDTPELLCAIVAQGLAVGFLSPTIAARYPGVVSVPLSDGPQRRQWLVWSDFNTTAATSAVLSLITDAAVSRG